MTLTRENHIYTKLKKATCLGLISAVPGPGFCRHPDQVSALEPIFWP